MVVVEVAVTVAAEVEDAAATNTETKKAAVPSTPSITLQRNGTNCPMMNVTKFERNVTGKGSREAPSVPQRNFPRNRSIRSQPKSSALSSLQTQKEEVQTNPTQQSLLVLAMHLEVARKGRGALDYRPTS
jgi:hypothetical protein